jgi:hypothetical protein
VDLVDDPLVLPFLGVCPKQLKPDMEKQTRDHAGSSIGVAVTRYPVMDRHIQ